ncbi:hypothetical protein [Undibacterium sp. Ji22W]|uniref:hypothetical protein n=1 Tax=Undibacterium sp. Ji22W TaxID=3413038 RepID=UPI003BF06F0C
MRVTPPVTIAADKLVSSSAVEPAAFPAYVPGSTYGFGEIVTVAADYRVYESLLPLNVGNTPSISPVWWRPVGYVETPYNPATNYPISATVSRNNRVYKSLIPNNLGQPLPVYPSKSTAAWYDMGATNRLAAFDLYRSTQTIWPSPLTMVFAPKQRVNTIGVLGISANQAVVSATSVFGGGTVYNRVIDLNTRLVSDGYEYAFEPFSTQPSFSLFDLPPFSDIVITLTLSSTSGNVKCGSVVVGTYIYLGDIQYGSDSSDLNFSVIERDDFGNAELTPRRSVPKNKHVLEAPSYRVNKIRAAKESLNAVPALWTGLDDGSNDWFDAFTILGIYKVFEANNKDAKTAKITLDIEEI